MKFLTLIVVAGLCAACGDATKKSGDGTNNVNANNANNQNNRNNLNIDTSGVDWTQAEREFCQRWGGQTYECTTSEEFSITAVLDDCERIRREQLAVCEYFTADAFEPCLEQIDSCPDSTEPFAENCAVFSDCISDFVKLAENNQNNASNNNVRNQPSEEFAVVSEILTRNCGLTACHGSASPTWSLSEGAETIPSDVYAVVIGWTAVSGLRLIEPGSADSSEIWSRLNRPVNDPLYMPLGGTMLQEDEYVAIRTWIENGAQY